MSLLLRAPAAVSFSSKAPAAKFATSAASSMSASAAQTSRKLPVLLFDIMDTVVRDPFYEDIPSFFGMSMKELIECKHPTSWMEFEKGMIDEVELYSKFFKDGRSFDMEGLKDCMKKGYRYLDGMKELLDTLKQKNYEMHALTNYPVWIRNVEAASEVGMKGIHFKNADSLREDLAKLGINVSQDGP
ncbi:Flavin mononucleotide hydrolase 1, chloroplatic [Linum grandiflorum]